MTPLVLYGGQADYCVVCGRKEMVRLVSHYGKRGRRKRAGYLVICPHSNHPNIVGLPICSVPFRVDQPRRAG